MSQAHTIHRGKQPGLGRHLLECLLILQCLHLPLPQLEMNILMIPAWSLMDLAQIWLKFTQTRSSWLRRLQALAKLPLQSVPTSQGLRRHQIPPLPAQHLYLKAPVQQIGRSEHLDLSLDRPMVQQPLQTLTAPRQGLAKALSHLRERSVLLKI